MHDMVRLKQQEYYDKIIAQLREELVEMETLGDWEAAAKIERLILEFQKRKEEVSQ